MLPYFCLLFISIILPMLTYKPIDTFFDCGARALAQKRNKITLRLFFCGFFALLAMRDLTVGSDLFEYRNLFELCQATSFDNLIKMKWEAGYTIYNKIVSIFTHSYRVFLMISAIVILIPIYKLYSKEENYSYLAILLFINMPCFLMIFSGIRQAIAMSIGIVAYIFLEKRKYILSGIMVFVAVLFHTSAFVLVLIYPAFFVKIKTKHLIFIATTIVAIYIWRVPLLQFLIQKMPSRYIESYSEIQSTGAVGMMILFLMFLAFSFIIQDENAMSKRDFFMRNMLLIATVFQIFVPIHGLIQRASYYFIVFTPVSILRVVQTPKKNMKSISEIAVFVMSFFFFTYFFYNAYFSTDNLLNVFPYKFCWSVR